MSNAGAPLPKFTIEELLREAVEAAPPDKRCVFTSRDLAKLWGYRALDSARKQMRFLEEEKGWKFIATQKSIVNIAGMLTFTNAYIVIPPAGEDIGSATDAARNNDIDDIIDRGHRREDAR